MKEFFARLNSMERRFVIAVLVVVFIVINVLFVVPRFSDWSALGKRMVKANNNLAEREKVIRKAQSLQRDLDRLVTGGGAVPPEDQENELLRTINTTAIECGATIMNNSTVRQTGVTNVATQFFTERIQQVDVVSGEPQLVDFLYKLGSGSSPVRVREMALNPDAPRYQLQAKLKLVASFQKKAPVRVAAPATNPPAAKAPPKTSPPLTKNPPTNAAPSTARPQSQKK